MLRRYTPWLPSFPELAHVLRVATRAMERDALAAIRTAGFGLVAPRHFTLLRVLDPETAGTRLSDLARARTRVRGPIWGFAVRASPRDGDIADWEGVVRQNNAPNGDGCPPGAKRIVSTDSNGHQIVGPCLPAAYFSSPPSNVIDGKRHSHCGRPQSDTRPPGGI